MIGMAVGNDGSRRLLVFGWPGIDKKIARGTIQTTFGKFENVCHL